MNPLSHPIVHVRWQELLDVYQGLLPGDEQMVAWLELGSGQITCRMFLGDDFERQCSAGDILQIPVKAAPEQHRQRVEFAESCCSPELRHALREALKSSTPFQSFDAVLFAVPIEATRWRETEREADQLALERWLMRAGYQVDPPAIIKRTVIEFPRRLGDS